MIRGFAVWRYRVKFNEGVIFVAIFLEGRGEIGVFLMIIEEQLAERGGSEAGFGVGFHGDGKVVISGVDSGVEVILVIFGSNARDSAFGGIFWGENNCDNSTNHYYYHTKNNNSYNSVAYSGRGFGAHLHINILP